MYTKIKSIVLCIILTCCTGCSTIFGILDHSSVEPFGNVSFVETGMIGCLDWLKDGDDVYYYVSSLDAKMKYDKAIGAFNDDEHGYTLYSLKGDEYKGITVLEYQSMMDTVQLVYVKDDVNQIPCPLLFDIPHIDSILDGGQNITLNNITYTSYGTASPSDISPGQVIGKTNDKTFYQVEGYSEWICTQNEADPERFDLYYDVRMETLPTCFVKMVKAINV